jgi:hypothetical protein
VKHTYTLEIVTHDEDDPVSEVEAPDLAELLEGELIPFYAKSINLVETTPKEAYTYEDASRKGPR